MMSKKQERVSIVRRTAVPVRLREQEPGRRGSAVAAHPSTPQAVARRTPVTRHAPAASELQTLQRALGNRSVQHMMGHGAGLIQRKLGKRDKRVKTKVEQLVKAGKHDDALVLICKSYGFTGKNFEIKVVPAMGDAWATTGGEIKAGAKQTLSIGKDLFDKDFVFVLRTIGHEFQHLKQRSQKKPIKNQKEREFLAWGWEALDSSVPTYSLAVAATHAKTALEFYDAMPEERKNLSSNKKRKKALEKLVKKATR